MKCEACGGIISLIKLNMLNGVVYTLCMNCHVALTNYSLSKSQFFQLLKNGHTDVEFFLHCDFYDDETGEALQPQ